MENVKLLEHAWDIESAVYVLAFLEPLSQVQKKKKKNGGKNLTNSHYHSDRWSQIKMCF